MDMPITGFTIERILQSEEGRNVNSDAGYGVKHSLPSKITQKDVSHVGDDSRQEGNALENDVTTTVIEEQTQDTNFRDTSNPDRVTGNQDNETQIRPNGCLETETMNQNLISPDIYAGYVPSSRRDDEYKGHLVLTEDIKKRPRTAFSAEQVRDLEQEFQKTKYLSMSRRMEMSKLLGLTEQQIKIWFQNRRTKWKRKYTNNLEILAHQQYFRLGYLPSFPLQQAKYPPTPHGFPPNTIRFGQYPTSSFHRINYINNFQQRP